MVDGGWWWWIGEALNSFGELQEDHALILHRLRRGHERRLHAHRELLGTSRVSSHSSARVPCTVTLVATSFTRLLYPSSNLRPTCLSARILRGAWARRAPLPQRQPPHLCCRSRRRRR